MNYSNHDCRLRTTGSKLARLFRRKLARKASRAGKSESSILAALRAVTQIGAALFAFGVAADAQTIIQPLTEATSKDTKIYFNTATMNFSSNLNLTIDFMPLVQFDLSTLGIPASQITNATISLYSTGIGATGTPNSVGGNVRLSPILNDWKENAGDAGSAPLATWNNFFGPTPTLGIGAVAATTNVTGGGYFTWDVTSLVKDWVNGATPNYGVIFQLEAANVNGDIGFADTDTPATGTAPFLTIVPEPGSALLALAGAGLFAVRRRRTASAQGCR